MRNACHAVSNSDFPQWDCDVLFKILDNIHDVVIVIDSKTTIVYANEAYARILGVPVAKVLGRRLDQIEPDAPVIGVLQTSQPYFGKQAYLSSLGIFVVASSFPLSQVWRHKLPMQAGSGFQVSRNLCSP
ncbi:PAS domain-containing protein [Desulfitobacterium sp.]|uniref:PAS domain-containing protein n=1 Tax=Desulfitobacterium sp. TaxID=49981 RepID=UPI002CCEE7DE|nr:PAS domain-containing protein [Desulfitobacterium sp.]HVJ49962.1 PAS domain-containing protein [Desulfitobacterium sp.]